MFNSELKKENEALKEQITELRITNARLEERVRLLEPPTKAATQPVKEEPVRIKQIRDALKAGSKGTPWQRHKQDAEAKAKEADHTTQGVVHLDVQ